MNSKEIANEFEKSLARAQASLLSKDADAFRAAVKELETLAGKNGRWQGAVNFLSRSIDPAPVSRAFAGRA